MEFFVLFQKSRERRGQFKDKRKVERTLFLKTTEWVLFFWMDAFRWVNLLVSHKVNYNSNGLSVGRFSLISRNLAGRERKPRCFLKYERENSSSFHSPLTFSFQITEQKAIFTFGLHIRVQSKFNQFKLFLKLTHEIFISLPTCFFFFSIKKICHPFSKIPINLEIFSLHFLLKLIVLIWINFAFYTRRKTAIILSSNGLSWMKEKNKKKTLKEMGW